MLNKERRTRVEFILGEQLIISIKVNIYDGSGSCKIIRIVIIKYQRSEDSNLIKAHGIIVIRRN